MAGFPKVRLLVLTSSTGGGHNMRAEAIKAWAESPDAAGLGIEVSIHHTLEETHPVYAFGVGLYNRIQQFWPKLHHLYFNFLEHACMHGSPDRIWGRRHFIDVVRAHQPDVVLSTHAHLNHGFFELARRAMPRNPPRTVIYCGELCGGYGFSRHWVNPKADLFIGAVPETCDAASRIGMPDARNWVGGFLLKPPFYDFSWNSEVRAEYLRRELGLDPSRFTLVLSTGLNGANNHLRSLRALAAQGVKPQIVAMCGRKSATVGQIEQWTRENPGFTVRALPYYNRMCALLKSASAVVARSGTGTTSEAIMSGCPVIFNGSGGIMPQEMITVKYCRKKEFGEVLYRTHRLPGIVRRWMQDPLLVERIRQRMVEQRPERHPLDILQRVHDLAVSGPRSAACA